MPKRKNYPYRSPEDIIKDSNRQYNELLQENKDLKKDIVKLQKALDEAIKVAKHNEEACEDWKNNTYTAINSWAKNISRLSIPINNLTLALECKLHLKDEYIKASLQYLDTLQNDMRLMLVNIKNERADFKMDDYGDYHTRTSNVLRSIERK